MEPKNYFKRYKRYYTYITPLFTSKRIRDYTYFVLTFFTAAFFSFSAIKPTVRTIAGLRRQIIDGRYSDSKLQDKINALSEGQEIISNVGSDLSLIGEAIPKRPTIDFLLRQLENLAQASTVSFHSLSFEGVPLRQNGDLPVVKPETVLKEISFNFSIKGNYENIILFLEKTRSLRRLLVLENIQIQKGKTKDEGEVLILSGKAKAFYRD